MITIVIPLPQAASRHHCTYLVKLHEQDFLLHNGNPVWLQGIQHAPKKLQDLYEINKILAHRPWLITKDHMKKLLKSSEPWSLSELMQAVILLTHFHSLCSFVYGCGINAELDMDDAHSQPSSQPASPAPGSGAIPPAKPYDCCQANGLMPNGDVHGTKKDSSVASLMAKMRQLTEVPANTTSPEELLKRFHSVEHQSAQSEWCLSLFCLFVHIVKLLNNILNPSIMSTSNMIILFSFLNSVISPICYGRPRVKAIFFGS